MPSIPTNPGSVSFQIEPTTFFASPNAVVIKSKPPRTTTSPTASIQDIFGCRNPSEVLDTEAFMEHHKQIQVLCTHPHWESPKTLVGIEVEVENIKWIDPNIPLAFWSVKEDGSLRNSGREFVTPGAIPLSKCEFALRQLFLGLNTDVDFSQRTSIHIHLDVRQLTFSQLLGFLYAYLPIENLLFKFVGNSRRSNIFCVPLGEISLMDRMGDKPHDFLRSIEHNWHKYTALNLLPIARQGSIEFRHMPGTSNIQKLLVWLELISKLKLFCYRHSMETIIGQVQDLNSNSHYRQFVESIFGDHCSYLDMSNLLKDMEKAVYIVKNCAIANHFNKHVLSSPSKDSHLGQIVNSWLRKLTTQQQMALHTLGDKWGNSNLEHLFKELITRGNLYIETYPKDKALILQVIKGT